MDQTPKTACKVKRSGTVIEKDVQGVVIRIEGKSLQVPIGKIGDEVVVNDRVQWNGSRWERLLD